MVKKLDAKETFRLLKRDLVAANDDAIPPGFKTIRQWAEETSMSVSQTGKILRRAADLGRAKVEVFRMGAFRIPHYRLIEAKGRK